MGKLTRHLVLDNRAQGQRMRVLFVCRYGILRSPTAAHWAAQVKRWNTRSAGISPDAVPPLHNNVVTWAQRIYVMEPGFDELIKHEHGQRHASRIRVLNIPDEFEYMDAKLIGLIARALADE